MSLRKQLEDVQLNLNKSFDKLEYNKETLNQQAGCVKEQVINNIVMQIDAFNQRKSWLINQLDLVKCDKMESILRQQEAIKCSMVKVKKMLSDISKFTSIQIKEELENINNLLAEETRPFLAFRSDSAALRETISQYGSILKQYTGHFADPTRPSISLPRVVEEEDDEDQISFTRKYEVQNKNDQNILYITKHPTNSSIVRAWLMTTNDTGNNIEIESDILKSDHESFVRIDSPDSSENKKTKDEILSQNEFKEFWLPKYGKANSSSVNEVKLVSKSEAQNNHVWLLSSDSVDEEKEIDHCDLVKKVCKGGQCKTFYGCSEIENCCHNLIDPSKPSWNKWLVDNHVINKQLLNNSSANLCKNQFSSKFAKILKSDNDKWLNNKKDCKRHIVEPNNEKMAIDSELWLSNKSPKIDFDSHNFAFKTSLEKWICWGREQEWLKDKEKMTNFVDKTFEKITLDEVDGLVNGQCCKNDNLGIDCNKWLANCK